MDVMIFDPEAQVFAISGTEGIDDKPQNPKTPKPLGDYPLIFIMSHKKEVKQLVLEAKPDSIFPLPESL